jgi:hypothetical protein
MIFTKYECPPEDHSYNTDGVCEYCRKLEKDDH